MTFHPGGSLAGWAKKDIIMAEKTAPSRRRSEKSTKQEMLEAYQPRAQELEEKRAAELAPERRAEEKRAEEAVKVASAVEPEGIDRGIGQLKSEVGKFLADISERLGSEFSRFSSVRKAVESKELEAEGTLRHREGRGDAGCAA